LRILVNAVAARVGGAATYLRHFLRLVAGAKHQFIVLTSRGVDAPYEGVQRLEYGPELRNRTRRFLFDQLEVPRLCTDLRCEALLSTNSFGSMVSPVRQVLLVRNPIYFTRLFLRRVSEEGTLSQWSDHFMRRALILESIAAADASVFPTQSMLDEVASWARLPRDRCHVVPHGFDAAEFRRRAEAHRDDFVAKMRPEECNVCFVSTYAPHKNVFTLCEAFALARKRQPPGSRRLRLWLTMDLEGRPPQMLPWPRDLAAFRALAREDGVTDLGTVPHGSVAGLYRASEAMVFPSLAESFGHPLKEAMSVALPIIASDIPVHREICGDAASYFGPTNVEALAEALVELATRGSTRRPVREDRLSFSWENHVASLEQLLMPS
jgi:glycosyltransferase involved in cell wall biosynthesis